MNSRNRLVLSLWLALLASTCLSAPSLAQKSETAAVSAKINELSRAGKYAEAVALAQGQVESLEKKYGPAHRDVGAALNNLAQLYGSQGRDAEAEPLFKRAIAILEKTVGLESPEIAAALNNLAALYQRQERYAEAEPLFKRALAIRERSLGPAASRRRAVPEQSGAPITRSRAAMTTPSRCSSARWRSTRKRRVRSIPRSRRLLNNLGQVEKVEGHFAEAEPLIKRSLAIREKVLGPDHPDVARSLNNLAELYDGPTDRSAMPSRFSSGRWRSVNARSAPIIRIPPHR